MKYLSLVLILMPFHFAFARSVIPADYKGQAEGVIRLNTEEGSALLGDGALDVSIERLNPLKHPVHFFNGARLITLTNVTMDTFQFFIPSETELVDGKATVTAEQSSQTADLSIQESRKFIDSKEQPGTTSCSKAGSCSTCGVDMHGNATCGMQSSSNCPGTKKVLYRVDTFERSLELLISNGPQSVRIQTEGNREYDRTALKTLEACH